MKKPISPQQRRHQDYLRRKGLKTGSVYETRLAKARAAEVKRVLKLCRDYYDPTSWPDVIGLNLNEPYLKDWYTGLYLNTGVDMAESTVRDLTRRKADTGSAWVSAIHRYAETRAGENIVSVTGTLRDALIGVLQGVMGAEGNEGLGIEKLARTVFRTFQKDVLLWQVRRIAQTETMISMAEAANIAAQDLDVRFDKQWCISGIGNTRDSHEAMDGMIIGQYDIFELEGGRMAYPHDSSLGADASEIINCACSCIRLPK